MQFSWLVIFICAATKVALCTEFSAEQMDMPPTIIEKRSLTADVSESGLDVSESEIELEEREEERAAVVHHKASLKPLIHEKPGSSLSKPFNFPLKPAQKPTQGDKTPKDGTIVDREQRSDVRIESPNHHHHSKRTNKPKFTRRPKTTKSAIIDKSY